MKLAQFIVATLVVLLSSSATFAGDDVAWRLADKNGKATNCKVTFTRLAKDAKGVNCFNADTKQSHAPWNTCITIDPGVMKAGQDYVVKLDYQVFDRPTDDTYFYVFARSGKLGQGADVWTTWHDAPGTRRSAILRIRPKSDDYGVYVGIHTKGSERIENLRIIHGNGYAEARLDGGAASDGGEPVPNVTGAKPFTIDAPKNPKGAVVSLADFGCVAAGASTASGGGVDRNLAALNTAIQKCRETGAAKLTVPKGVYRITSGKTITFKDLHDFTFDGNGSTFLFDTILGGAGMSISETNRCVFRNFNLDWDWKKDPLASVGRITKLAPDKSWFEMRFEENAPLDPKRWPTMLELDERLRVPGDGPEFGNFGPKKLARLDAKTVRVYPTYPLAVNVGKLYLLRHYVYEKHAIVLGGDTHLSVRDVTIFSFPGEGFVMGGDNHHCEFQHCTIGFPPNNRRPITLTADGFHVDDSQGFLKLENCDFGYMGDDCVNIHDQFRRGVQRMNDHSLLLTNMVLWRCPFAAGDLVELRNPDYSPTKFESKLTNVQVDWKASKVVLTFDKPLPVKIDPQSILFNRRYHSNNIIIRGCDFHENRARGVLLKTADNLVENNRFYHNQHNAVQLTVDTDSNWSEGTGPRNTVFRGNQFDSCNCLGVTDGATILLTAEVGGTPVKYEALNSILFENNIWNATTGPAIRATSFNKLVLSHNHIENFEPASTVLPMRGAILVQDATGLWVNNNEWADMKGSQHPSVFYDPSNVRQIYYSGNSVSKPIK
ncbi:MAG TPA: right-handed parallel beta-helix repeat-containing protein [Planktothrix sp.]